jgi:hypothetical protein
MAHMAECLPSKHHQNKKKKMLAENMPVYLQIFQNDIHWVFFSLLIS